MKFNQDWLGYRIHNGVKSAPFKVSVPGNIQYDYGVANNFKDLYYADGCRQYEELEDDSWEYETTLNYTKKDGDSVFFVSDGIEYKYQILVNGIEVYSNEGMYAPVEVDVTKLLTGNDILTVKIAPHPKRAGAPKDRCEADHSAKPPMCYGWDWNPRLLISGLYTNAYIETRNDSYISNPQVTYKLSDDFSVANVEFKFDSKVLSTITLTDDCGSIVYSGTQKTFDVAFPKLWWCAGEGEQTLYTYTIENSGYKVSGKIGFRRAKLVENNGAWTKPGFPKGPENPPITLELNGRRIFMKGSNFVNADVFPGRTPYERYYELVRLAKDANMNIFRMWGGSGPMHKCFYEICDELGIMVWQEFMLSCNKYPSDEHYLEVLEKEAKSVILNLIKHPCLVMWCGGNELFNGWSGMDEQSLPLRLLDKLCYEYSRDLPFIKTSPIMGMAHGGYTFYDEVRFGGDMFNEFQRANNTAYTEFGVPSIAPLDVLKKIIPENEIFPIEETESYILHHAKKAWRGDTWACTDILEKYFGKPDGIEDLIAQSNWIQCEGYRASFEEMRRQWPVCSAALNWVYNEPWYTAANNSILVFPATPKPAYYAIKSALRPVLFSARVPKFKWIEGEKFKAEIWLLNDSNEAVTKSAKVYLTIGDKTIELLKEVSGSVSAKTNVECASVCCALPEVQGVVDMYLVLESEDGASNKYRLAYEPFKKIVKPKILNDV